MVAADDASLASTNHLHVKTAQLLLQRNQLAAAARYNLKRAIMELGPSGYPFEQFVAQVLERFNYQVRTNQQVPGKCVTHEVDIIAQKKNQHYLVECKHHQFIGAKTDVKVALYVYARFLDVSAVWQQRHQLSDQHYQPWVITNTKVTSDAIQYAQCVQMRLLAWHFPAGEGLNHLLEEQRLYPITVLPMLTVQEKQLLIKQQIIVIDQFVKQPLTQLFKRTGIRHDVLTQAYQAAGELLS